MAEFPLALCPKCGGDPEGTCETTPGVALLRRTEDGQGFNYAGDTRMHWDGQTPQTDTRGRLLYWCNNCDLEYVYTAPDLVVHPPTELAALWSCEFEEEKRAYFVTEADAQAFQQAWRLANHRDPFSGDPV
jgi:hypothetical protein